MQTNDQNFYQTNQIQNFSDQQIPDLDQVLHFPFYLYDDQFQWIGSFAEVQDQEPLLSKFYDQETSIKLERCNNIIIHNQAQGSTGLTTNAIKNPAIQVDNVLTSPLQTSLDFATCYDFSSSHEQKRYFREIEQEIFKISGQSPHTRLEAQYRQFFRWLMKLLRKNEQFGTALRKDQYLKKYAPYIRDLKKSPQTQQNQSQGSENLFQNEPILDNDLLEFQYFDIKLNCCKKMNRADIVEYFSYDVLSYLFEFMLPYIDVNQRTFSENTHLARRVLEQIKFNSCGSQEAIIERENSKILT
ncbi:UNKNOWN [Stylonychia lemnae]|uniref:Uncharacterized protein n=1 Tax=Stylonychia lemnae TaxID=5949 RepID=A0A077ZSF7_STYLE|nr:UNKNOWN [Stylonychia lemnae]|eukprot:CDW71396.1 UNKNOWN [Stylonychia lemnae]